MERVRGEVEKELGYTTSAGIGHNKNLAKVCSAFKKPRAQVSRVALLFLSLVRARARVADHRRSLRFGIRRLCFEHRLSRGF